MNRNVWNGYRKGPWDKAGYRRGELTSDEIGGRIGNRDLAPREREREETMEEEIERHLRTLESRRRH